MRKTLAALVVIAPFLVTSAFADLYAPIANPDSTRATAWSYGHWTPEDAEAAALAVGGHGSPANIASDHIVAVIFYDDDSDNGS